MVIPWWPLTRRRLLRQIDTLQIEQAIERAESKTTGEIRVSVAGFFRGDVNRLAERAFDRLGMRATRHRNGVLILLAPTRRRVVILGDEKIHARVGSSFWSGLADSLAQRFKDRDFTSGLVDAIDQIARQLASHFPASSANDVNELPNAVDSGGRAHTHTHRKDKT